MNGYYCVCLYVVFLCRSARSLPLILSPRTCGSKVGCGLISNSSFAHEMLANMRSC